MSAKADVVVDGVLVLSNVPVDTLIDGAKDLIRLRELFKKAPTVDASFKWEAGEIPHTLKRGPVETYRKEKKIRAQIMTPATDKHPAVFKEINEDIIVGSWYAVYTSGMLTAQQKHALLTEVDKLRD